MNVTLSLFAGAGAQFLDNNGNILSGGLIYTYGAGTTTPLATYTSNLGNTYHSNPIILDSAGRVPGGEIWLTTGYGYKFVTKDANDVLIGTYDNIPSSAQPPITNDASSIAYEPGYVLTAGSFIVGQSYLITFVGTTNFQLIGASANQIGVYFIATGTGSGTGTAQFSRTVQAKFQEFVSVKDFGAVGNGTTDDTIAVQAALSSGAKAVYAPYGTYLCSSLSVPSNITFFGDGTNSTIFKVKNNTNTDLFVIDNKSYVLFKNFRVEGNSDNQTAGNSFIVKNGSNNISFENIVVNDYYDWGFCFFVCNNIKATNCGATNGKAGANGESVRGGFLLGSYYVGAADKVMLTNCYVECSNIYVDGFMSEYGSAHQIIGCRTAVAYTGFKIKGNSVIVEGCYATGGTQGYQTQINAVNLTFVGNIAYRCGESGFFFSNAVTSNPLVGLVITGNSAIENGQNPSSTSYGFAFENVAGSYTSEVVLSNNIAIDNQAIKTQSRGISFGESGQINNIYIDGNYCKGNTLDMYLGPSIQLSTTTFGWNPQFNSVAGYPTTVRNGYFWADTPVASSGTIVCSDGVGSLGYMIPRNGYIRSVAVSSTTPVTAGSITFQLRVNGVINSDFNVTLDTTNPSFNITTVPMIQDAIAVGDVITIQYAANSSYAPSGVANFNVVVEFAY